MNRPEWIAVIIGCIACVCAGATLPAFATLLLKQVMVIQFPSLYFS